MSLPEPGAELVAGVTSLLDAVPALIDDALDDAQLEQIITNGFLRPAQNEDLAHWFARFLTQREALWDVIHQADAALQVPLRHLRADAQWRWFLLGYAAACLLVRQDRCLLEQVARHSVIQRKLNEAFPEYGIPRKSYSGIFSDYTDPADALALLEAMRVAKRHRLRLQGLASDPSFAPIALQLVELESALIRSKRRYLRGLLQFLAHRWRRRGASATQQTVFAVLEGFGRTASHLDPGRWNKQVTADVRAQIAALLEPGDVLVSRHRYALTNYLLPGNWPHASLYVGTPSQRATLGVHIDPAIESRWCGEKCTLEALRDGVRFRPLTETLNVDCFVVLRPKLSTDGIRTAIERVVVHEGKGYNFDFDFFTSDKLVCTEVIYRAFDGVESMTVPLYERAGRQTLSAEQLLDLSVDADLFTPVAIFGYPKGEQGVLTGVGVRRALIDSYRSVGASRSS
ncbi:MAG: YiiX/YebB-like N1pC/P60 family cysteine hydrolase [Gammaproteobacteria bacterium]